MTATTRKQSRRANDFYPTPALATRELIERIPITGTVLECCSGDYAIASSLSSIPGVKVFANDIDRQRIADSHWDATIPENWMFIGGAYIEEIDWCITNPPFSEASKILPIAYEYSRTGVAFLLRLSYLEPCQDRASWLIEHPVSKLIVLPRISFTGDGKTDSVTCAWLVWIKGAHSKEQSIEIVARR